MHHILYCLLQVGMDSYNYEHNDSGMFVYKVIYMYIQ